MFLAQTCWASWMKAAFLVILVVVTYGVTVTAFWMTSPKSLTIYPSMDSYSWQSIPHANNGGSNNFEITSASQELNKNMRGWLAFNISAIPSGIWVINAELRLRIWHKTTSEPSELIGDSTGRIYAVYRLTQPWTEYGITWANQPAYTEEHHTTAAVPPGQGGWEGPILWMEWDIPDIVKDWLSGAGNYGVLVRDMQENSTILYSTQFFTRDQVPNSGYYPRLIVTYVTPQEVALFSIVLILEGFLIISIWRRRESPRAQSEV